MAKYIDADLLRKEIKRLKDEYTDIAIDSQGGWVNANSVIDDLEQLQSQIDSLQQEQLVNNDLGTLIACDIIEMTAKKAIDKPQDKEKEEELMTRKINYLISLEENYVQQEQPEVDLEKEIADYWTATEWCKIMTLSKFKVIARYFYGLGLNAKEENK